MSHKRIQKTAADTRVLVVGASGRMTAAMLSRLGFRCSVADLYGDIDTEQICDGRITKLQRLGDMHLQESLVREHDCVVFAGGLEGQNELSSRIAKWCTPAFASVECLEQLATVECFNEAMTCCGMDRFHFHRDVGESRFPVVAKSLEHSGTARLAKSPNELRDPVFSGWVLQEFIEGQSLSQIFVSDGEVATLLGTASHLARGLQWIGAISGDELEDSDQKTAVDFANAIARSTNIKGIFGIDFMLNDDGIWPVDINPRIPASAEIVGLHVMQAHMNAFGIDVGSSVETQKKIQGKLVLFNTSDDSIKFSRNKLANWPMQHLSSSTAVSIADVPRDGELIEPTFPIMTVLASENSVAEVRAELSKSSIEIMSLLSAEKQ